MLDAILVQLINYKKVLGKALGINTGISIVLSILTYTGTPNALYLIY